jgi:hypothetical protein
MANIGDNVGEMLDDFVPYSGNLTPGVNLELTETTPEKADLSPIINDAEATRIGQAAIGRYSPFSSTQDCQSIRDRFPSMKRAGTELQYWN